MRMISFLIVGSEVRDSIRSKAARLSTDVSLYSIPRPIPRASTASVLAIFSRPSITVGPTSFLARADSTLLGHCDWVCYVAQLKRSLRGAFVGAKCLHLAGESLASFG